MLGKSLLPKETSLGPADCQKHPGEDYLYHIIGMWNRAGHARHEEGMAV